MGRMTDEVVLSESGTRYYRAPKSASKVVAVTSGLRTARVVPWSLAKATAAQMAGRRPVPVRGGAARENNQVVGFGWLVDGPIEP